ncbi:hypothetical protein BH09BAC6_BH09BAC6_17500 [soil metagenome]
MKMAHEQVTHNSNMKTFLYWMLVILGLISTISIGMIIINWCLNARV